MSELANYSIETDHVVLLSFRDGRRLRVPIGQLTHYLAPADLAKVKEAIQLRHEFIRKHMPKAVLILAAGGLIALLAVGGQTVAHLLRRPGPVAPAPDHTGIVRSQMLATPALPPAPQPGVQRNPAASMPPQKPGLASHSTAIRQAAAGGTRVSLPVPQIAPLPAVTLQVPVALPIGGTPAPTPVPSEPPAPSPSPTPQAPPAGAVLGDSTAPLAP